MRLDGRKVRWHRDRFGWTLDTLAEQAGVAKGTLLRAEHGDDIQPRSGRRIARAFGVDISELVPEQPGVVLPKGEAPSTSGQPKRPKPIFDLAREAVLKQAEEDRQAIARARESGLPQDSFVRHENQAMRDLLDRNQADLAEGYVDLMKRYVWLQQENAQLREQVEALERQLEEVGA
jgi:transcriptional regulator with XRE-family HTH domain